MPEQTVREQLQVALEAMGAAISPDVYRKAAADLGRMEVAESAIRLAHAAIERANREPEEDCCHLLDGCIEYTREAGRQ
jgi:hypothetical protein